MLKRSGCYGHVFHAEDGATYADTPTGTHLDALGRPVRVVTVNTGGVEALTRTELDVTGNPLRIVDARDNVAQENVYGLGGQLLHEDSVDAGWRRAITDVVGNPLRAFNARGFVQRWRYDEALRPTHHYVAFPTANGPGPERLVTRTVYGESLASPEGLNLRGRAHRVLIRSIRRGVARREMAAAHRADLLRGSSLARYPGDHRDRSDTLKRSRRLDRLAAAVSTLRRIAGGIANSEDE